MYRPLHDPASGKFVGVQSADGSCIPNDPANADWQRFLLWQNDPENKQPVWCADMKPGETRVKSFREMTLADLTPEQKAKLLDLALERFVKAHPDALDLVRG